MREGEASSQVIPEVPHSFHLIQRSLISVGGSASSGCQYGSGFDFPLSAPDPDPDPALIKLYSSSKIFYSQQCF
jgi:hypothetical protein